MKITKTYFAFYRAPYTKKSKLVKIHKSKTKRYFLEHSGVIEEIDKDFFNTLKKTINQ